MAEKMTKVCNEVDIVKVSEFLPPKCRPMKYKITTSVSSTVLRSLVCSCWRFLLKSLSQSSQKIKNPSAFSARTSLTCRSTFLASIVPQTRAVFAIPLVRCFVVVLNGSGSYCPTL